MIDDRIPEPPTPLELRDARGRFDDLLKMPRTQEADWQTFFAECPYVLSESLPVRLHSGDIEARGRPGKSEADFLFYPRDPERTPYTHGVIELKRPDTKILTQTRANILQLSRDAQTAVSQASVYLQDLSELVITHRYRMLALGNERHAFIILGLSEEIATKVTSDLMGTYDDLLPDPRLRLIPYDTLFEMFTNAVPPRIHVLVSATRLLTADTHDGPRMPRVTGLSSVEALLVMWQAGNEHAWSRLVESIRPSLTDFVVRKHSLPPDDAEDVVSEALEHIAAGIQSDEPMTTMGRFETYVTAVVGRIAGSKLKLRLQEQATTARIVNELDMAAPDAPAEEALDRILAQQLLEALELLTPNVRRILVLQMEGLTTEEIACNLRTSASLVERRLAGARQRFSDALMEVGNQRRTARRGES